MPITRLLTDGDYTPEQRQVLELAFNNTLRKLGLVDRSDPICEIVAHTIIKIAENGMPNAADLGEIAIKELGFPDE
jgi:hypothetical protein